MILFLKKITNYHRV